MVPFTPGKAIPTILERLLNLRLCPENKERNSKSQIPQKSEKVVIEKGVPGPPPTFWNGHLIVLLNVKEVPVQKEWRGQEGPEGLFQVALCSLQKFLLD